jgi:hypothetical protein
LLASLSAPALAAPRYAEAPPTGGSVTERFDQPTERFPALDGGNGTREGGFRMAADGWWRHVSVAGSYRAFVVAVDMSWNPSPEAAHAGVVVQTGDHTWLWLTIDAAGRAVALQYDDANPAWTPVAGPSEASGTTGPTHDLRLEVRAGHYTLVVDGRDALRVAAPTPRTAEIGVRDGANVVFDNLSIVDLTQRANELVAAGQAEHRNGRAVAALELLVTARDLDPEHDGARWHLALRQEELGLAHGAAQSFAEHMQVHATDAGIHLAAAQGFVRQLPRIERPTVVTKRAVQAQARGSAHVKAREAEPALQAFREAAAAAPWWPDPYFSLALGHELLATKGDHAQVATAAAYYEIFLATARTDDPRVTDARRRVDELKSITAGLADSRTVEKKIYPTPKVRLGFEVGFPLHLRNAPDMFGPTITPEATGRPVRWLELGGALVLTSCCEVAHPDTDPDDGLMDDSDSAGIVAPTFVPRLALGRGNKKGRVYVQGGLDARVGPAFLFGQVRGAGAIVSPGLELAIFGSRVLGIGFTTRLRWVAVPKPRYKEDSTDPPSGALHHLAWDVLNVNLLFKIK